MSDSALIRAHELAELVGQGEPVTILDVRWSLAGAQPDLFAQKHIPGAFFCDLERDLSDHTQSAEDAGRHPLPTAAAFSSSMQALGVNADELVVVYDAKESLAAARAWWCLTYFGHRNVRVLDGGFANWLAEGKPTEAGSFNQAGVPRGDFHAAAGNLPTVSIDHIASGEGLVLVDVRAPERFRGDHEPIDPVPGHIPGAINSPTLDLIEPDGRFLLPDAIRARFEASGVIDGAGLPVVAYCGSGVTAAHSVLALSLIGISAALFPGSYSQWCRNSERPVVRGGV